MAEIKLIMLWYVIIDNTDLKLLIEKYHTDITTFKMEWRILSDQWTDDMKVMRKYSLNKSYKKYDSIYKPYMGLIW